MKLHLVLALMPLLAAAPLAQTKAAARLLPARWDTGFGLRGAEDDVTALATFDDGSGPALYVGGHFSSAGNQADPGLARWNGTRWEGLGVPWEPEARIEDLCVYDPGTGAELFVAGELVVGGVDTGLASWDGQRWTVYDLQHPYPDPVGGALQRYGPYLVLGGSFDSVEGVAAQNIAIYDGSAWYAMGTGLPLQVQDLAVSDCEGTSSLYAGTIGSGVNMNTLYRWSGASWASVAGLKSSVLALAHYQGATGSRLLVGTTSFLKALGGGAFQTFAPTPPANVSSLYVDPGAGFGGEDVIYAGGPFTKVAGVKMKYLTRYDGTGWSALGNEHLNNTALAVLTCDLGQGERTYVGGSFFQIGTESMHHLAVNENGQWSRVGRGGGLGGSMLEDFCVFDDGGGARVYAGGRFETAGGRNIEGLARWNGRAWEPVPGAPFTRLDLVMALHVWDDGYGPALYVGGLFYDSGNNGILKWDGTTWSSLGSGLIGFSGNGGDAYAIQDWDDGTGSRLYVGGSFLSAGGVASKNLAAWDGTSWSRVADIDRPGSTNSVRALEVFSGTTAERLYVGGRFTKIDGATFSHIAAWDGSTWDDMQGGVNNEVFALQAVDIPAAGNVSLIVGGGFSGAGSVSGVGGIARWKGDQWGNRLPYPVNGSRTYALASFHDGIQSNLVAAGSGGIARLDGTGWTRLGNGTAYVQALLSTDAVSGEPSLWVGGSFTSVTDRVGAHRAARWFVPLRPVPFATDEPGF